MKLTVTEYSILSLGAGEGFPIGAVTAGRPSTDNIYTAVEDVFCYLLPAEDFLALMAMSPEFNLFCTQYIASLLDQSRRQLQLQFAQRASEQQTLNSPLSGIGSPLANDGAARAGLTGGAGENVASRDWFWLSLARMPNLSAYLRGLICWIGWFSLIFH